MSLLAINDEFPFRGPAKRGIDALVARNRWVVKRAIDIQIALIALVALSPLLVLTAILIRATMGPGVIFGHRRVGRDGQPFRCLKFRTMVSDAESVLNTYLATNPEAAREWEISHKLRKDPRITRIGRLLRASSIDELPQLLNVLMGHMSCVGPRPITFAELHRYEGAACAYFRLRPGLTGPWQVSGRSSVSYGERVALDLAYVHNWTLRQDALIVLKTFPALIRIQQAS